MKRIIATFLFFLMATLAYAVQQNSPIGYWKQYDDHTGKLQSLVQIYQAKNGDLEGKVITGFMIDGKAPELYCIKCPGNYHNRRIAEMTILWGMQEKNGVWQNGQILDPNSGSIYHAEMRLLDGGEKLSIRGYIGISLFGRSQTWVRVQPDELPTLMKEAYPQPKALYTHDAS